MFDRYLVRQDSLENVYDAFGRAVGFRFAVRNSNYRGVFASLVNGFYIVLDGEQYPRAKQRFSVNGRAPRTMDEMKNAGFEHWDMGDEAWVYVEKPGGLQPGKHTLLYKQSVFAAYGYFEGCETYVGEIEPYPVTRHYLVMDKTYFPVEFTLELQR